MLDKKTDFPQSQSVQNGVENLPLLFDRNFILEDGQKDVRLFGDSYFVLDVGAAIGADDFRSQNPGPDKFFVTSLAKRVFVDLEEMRRTAFVKDILYFLDAPNYQQALFISKENAGDTISLKNCRGLASAISLFDWDKLMGDLGGIAKDLAKNSKDIKTINTGLKEAGEKIDVNAKGIAVNAQNIAQRLIAPQNTNWFLQASEDTEGMEYFLDNAPSETVFEIESAQVFNGAISSPFVFSGDAQIFLRAKNGNENSKNLSVELLVNGVSAGAAQYTLNPGAEFSTVNIKIPSVKIDAKNASDEAPYPIALVVTPDSGAAFLAGGVQTPSLMQFQGGGETGNSDIYIIGDITTLSLSSTPEEIESIFGGPGGFEAFYDILKASPQKLVAMKNESGGGLSPITAVLLQNELSVQFFVNTFIFIFSIVVYGYSELTVSDYEIAQVLLGVPAATKTTLGGIIVGDNLAISEEGVLSAVGGGDVFETKKYTTEYSNWAPGVGNKDGTIMELRAKRGVFLQIRVEFSLSGTINAGNNICWFIIPRIDRSKIGDLFYMYVPLVDISLGTIPMAAEFILSDYTNPSYPNTSIIAVRPVKNLTASGGYISITGAWNIPLLT